MELIHAHQITFEELKNESIDILIAACGYESRSTHLIQLLNFNAKKKIALLFKENSETGSRKENEELFKTHGFECYELSGSSSYEIEKVLRSICNDSNCDQVKLLVDYSSMTRLWYGTIINYLTFNELNIKNLVIYFAYTPEHYLTPDLKRVEYPKPTPVFFNRTLINSNKPVSLIVGLGYDEKKVDFLCDFFKPDDVLLFMPNPSFDDNYTNLAKQRNENVLKSVTRNNIFYYSATNIEEIDSKLTSTSLNLRLKNRIIIISLGPKTFSLASFLLNARYPDIEIWQMSDSTSTYDLMPADLPIVYKAILVNDDEE
jgi:hypothetical protein